MIKGNKTGEEAHICLSFLLYISTKKCWGVLYFTIDVDCSTSFFILKEELTKNI